MAGGDRTFTDFGFFKFSGAGVAVTYPTVNIPVVSNLSGCRVHLVPSANGMGYHIIRELSA
jgi:hypothetical protein